MFFRLSVLFSAMLLLFCSTAMADAPKGTIVDIPEAFGDSGEQLQRLNAALPRQWSGVDIESGQPLSWGAKGVTYMEALASLASATGLAPQYFSGQLNLAETKGRVATEGPFMIAAVGNRFGRDELGVYLLVEPSLRAGKIEAVDVKIGGAEVKVDRGMFDLESYDGFSGAMWKVKGASKLSGDLEVTIDVELITQKKELVLELKPGETKTVGDIQLTIDKVERGKSIWGSDSEEGTTVRYSFSGASLMNYELEGPGYSIKGRQGRFPSKPSGSFAFEVPIDTPETTKVRFVFATETVKHQITQKISGIDYEEWFKKKED